MTAEEKAGELVWKYKTVLASHFMLEVQLKSYAKQCALIAVDEILNIVTPIRKAFDVETDGYWETVKEEINKL